MMISYCSPNRIVPLIFLILIIDDCCLKPSRCELYTSVDELSRWPNITKQFSAILSELIRAEEEKLDRMHLIQESLMEALSPLLEDNNYSQDSSEDYLGNSSSDLKAAVKSKKNTGNYNRRKNEMSNPISAFVTLNRLVKAIDDAHQLLDGELSFDGGATEEDHHNNDETNKNHQFGRLNKVLHKLKKQLPAQEDLIGSGEAMLRLQAFYDLDIDQLVNGKLPVGADNSSAVGQNGLYGAIRMNADDCFELGRIAFHNDKHSLAIQWLLKALELTGKSDPDKTGDDGLVSNILEYMAFSAYKLGQIDYAAKLTKAWLERDPQNERALDNLQYYSEELKQVGSEQQQAVEDYSDEDDPHPQQQQSGGQQFVDVENYSIQNDQIVRKLCLQKSSTIINDRRSVEGENKQRSDNLKCYLNQVVEDQHESDSRWFLGPVKVEVLNERPKIIRLHEIVSEKEANHIRMEALPKLLRSTIHSSDGLKPSDFRVAKTAWLSGKTDPLIEHVENRLSSILNLNLDNSEQLQVVNYGLGGFYGPHLDSTRRSASGAAEKVSLNISEELERSDRLATILIYLNEIDAGGSTVFPRLNVAATPIYRSAIVWFNILESGWSDELTLHTGCPVLLGSKWIATKWPREAANSFLRPCKKRLVK